MRAWKFQDGRQKAKLGAAAPWSVGWIDPDRRRRSKRIGSKSMAEKYRKKIEGQLAAGTYENVRRVSWRDFRKRYETDILSRLKPRSRTDASAALRHFERIIKPATVAAIKTAHIDTFRARRALEAGKKPGSVLSPSTVKKELSSIRAAMNKAKDWEYIAKTPKFDRVKVPEADPRPVTREHFEAMYQAADVATMPGRTSYSPGDWWRAIFMFAVTTGWRKDEILEFRREDLDLETGRIVTRAQANKGGRDDVDYLPEPTLAHLRLIRGFDPVVFPWPHANQTFDAEFHRIQRAAGIHLPCIIQQEHECTPTCHTYGMHDVRRMYATENADRLPLPVLQKKMRHRDISTTMRYVEMASKMKKATEAVYVPNVTRKAN